IGWSEWLSPPAWTIKALPFTSAILKRDAKTG
ncbi:hypothetical protein VC116059_001829B, partial [Vibrio cholerae O1 str. 116059]